MSSRSRSRSGRPGPSGRVTPKGVRPPGTPASRAGGAPSAAPVDRRLERRSGPPAPSRPSRAVVPRPGRGGDR